MAITVAAIVEGAPYQPTHQPEWTATDEAPDVFHFTHSNDFHGGNAQAKPTQACQPPSLSGEFAHMQHLCQYFGGFRLEKGCTSFSSEGLEPDECEVGFDKPYRRTHTRKEIGAKLD